MIHLPLSPGAEAYGRDIKKTRDKAGVKDYFDLKSAHDKRWIGFAVEYELDRFLRDSDIPYAWNGGMDSKPDFEIGGRDGLRVASKSNSGDGPRSSFQFILDERQTKKLADVALFSIVDLRKRDIWIAGVIRADEFLERAVRVKKGEVTKFNNKRAVADCRTIRADQLHSPEEFFAMFKPTGGAE